MRSLGEALSHPGIDPRIWVSLATVDDEEVVWDQDLGALIPITEQPSGVQTYAVLGQSVAGNQEGQGSPFVAGDLLLVANPDGSEKADTVVICRLSSDLNPPPALCGGQDTSKNNISWKRTRAPHFEEYGDRWTVKSAVTDALLSFDATGNITVRDGSGGVLQMSSSSMGYQNSNASCVLQFGFVEGVSTTALIQAGSAMLLLNSNAIPPMSSLLIAPNTLQIGTSGNSPFEHAISTEATCNVLYESMLAQMIALTTTLGLVMAALTTATSTTPGSTILVPASAPAIASIGSLAGLVDAWIALGVTRAATSPTIATIAEALVAAFKAQPPKTQANAPATPATGQMFPGIGCQGLMIG